MDQQMAQSFSLHQVALTQDSVKNTKVMVEAMKSTTVALKSQVKQWNVDAVEEMQDELSEWMEEAKEMQEMLGRSYGVPEDIDESELEAELELLQGDWQDTFLLTDDLPAVPSATNETNETTNETTDVAMTQKESLANE